MPPQPRDYLVVHPLPPAPAFVGRQEELSALRGLWHGGFCGVLALVGLGGAGKTALAARFLDEIVSGRGASAPEGLFVWSFYQEPDAGLFLQRACEYFAGPTLPSAAKGAGLLHLLREALAAGGPHWLVLDGLERVQCQDSSSTQSYGQIEDPLLKGLLTRIAGGLGQTVALVTSRFPLTDLQSAPGAGYRHVDVGGLSLDAALTLLRARGVKGDDAALVRLTENYGSHALTLDHLGGLIGQFLEGDPRRAPEVELANPTTDRQAFRLARLLRAYEKHLPPAELALLCRLCLLRRSAKEEHVVQFFLCTPPVRMRTIRESVDLINRLAGLDSNLNQDLAESIGSALEEALCSDPIAGPEDTFRAEVIAAAEQVVAMQESQLDMEFGELAQFYSDPALENPTDALPLPACDRESIRRLYANYVELSQHPLLPFQSPEDSMSFELMSPQTGKKQKLTADLVPADVLRGLKLGKAALGYLAAKHLALKRVRQLCRLSQRKSSLAGPLASLDGAELRHLLESLVGRHLIVREGDGSYSVHPAVRDHFQRLASGADEGAWHDVLREHLMSLVQRPGKRQPEDRATLDLAEEAIHHALAAGRCDEAHWLYRQVLGGLRHLGWKLGEMARGLRILRSFKPCPERWDLAWYLRALGEFDEAFACNELPYFRADILLLQGRLPEVANAGDSTRKPVAKFLMGRSTALPPDQLGSAIPRAQLLLYLGQLERVRRSAMIDEFYRDIGLEGDRARCRLLLAEVARRQADETAFREHLDAASGWIVHSGSVEHLCLLHLLRSRFERTKGNLATAKLAVTEGLHVARQCGLGLGHVELLCEQAEVLIGCGDLAAAENAAAEAIQLASAPQCQFLWGAGHAGHLLGRTLLLQKRDEGARRFLQETLELRRRIGDPGAGATERLLAIVPGEAV